MMHKAEPATSKWLYAQISIAGHVRNFARSTNATADFDTYHLWRLRWFYENMAFLSTLGTAKTETVANTKTHYYGTFF